MDDKFKNAEMIEIKHKVNEIINYLQYREKKDENS